MAPPEPSNLQEQNMNIQMQLKHKKLYLKLHYDDDRDS